MFIVVWVVLVLLALAFLGAGVMKVSQPIDNLKKNMGWVSHTTPGIVRLVGALEILGALGLILPLVTHILPWLTLAAAIGLVCTMIGAVIVHVRLNDTKGIGAPIVLLLLCLFIVYGSFAVLGVA